MSFKSLFTEAVQGMESLPAPLREHAGNVAALEEHSFDVSYIEFLDSQIRLTPRGKEWNDRLIRRRAALLSFCGITLLRGTVRAGDKFFAVEVDPMSRTVIHWEEYDQAM